MEDTEAGVQYMNGEESILVLTLFCREIADHYHFEQNRTFYNPKS